MSYREQMHALAIAVRGLVQHRGQASAEYLDLSLSAHATPRTLPRSYGRGRAQ